MKRMLNITRKKRCQIPRSWLGLCSYGFMKLHFKTLRERCHDWSKAGGTRMICFGKCASTLIPQRVQSVSLPHVTYARQTRSDRGWKVRTQQCQQASGCFRSNATCTRFPCAALRARLCCFHDLFMFYAYAQMASVSLLA